MIQQEKTTSGKDSGSGRRTEKSRFPTPPQPTQPFQPPTRLHLALRLVLRHTQPLDIRETHIPFHLATQRTRRARVEGGGVGWREGPAVSAVRVRGGAVERGGVRVGGREGGGDGGS